jgi:uncharacterized protein (TIGR04255 family)
VEAVPHYKKAPITEAVIDLRVRLPQDTPVERLRKTIEGQSDRFPKVVDLNRFSFRVELGAEPQESANEKYGFLFSSEDGTKVAQARMNGFAFSWLAPYDKWEPFRDEAREMWRAYTNAVNPEAVTRIAVRYINRFDLPLPIRDFKDYFLTYPEVSQALPQGLSGFFSQVQIPYPDLGAMLVLTQTIVPPPLSGFVSVVLDIDLSCSAPIAGDQSIWEQLEQLRSTKNDVFEGCITDAARELIR